MTHVGFQEILDTALLLWTHLKKFGNKDIQFLFRMQRRPTRFIAENAERRGKFG